VRCTVPPSAGDTAMNRSAAGQRRLGRRAAGAVEARSSGRSADHPARGRGGSSTGSRPRPLRAAVALPGKRNGWRPRRLEVTYERTSNPAAGNSSAPSGALAAYLRQRPCSARCRAGAASPSSSCPQRSIRSMSGRVAASPPGRHGAPVLGVAACEVCERLLSRRECRESLRDADQDQHAPDRALAA
jgi:hypothetical protein